MTGITPKVGMRVIYGRSGYNRTGWLGRVVLVSDNCFEVVWNQTPDDSTTYRKTAWSNTNLDGHWVEKGNPNHYIFLYEDGGECTDGYTTEKKEEATSEDNYMKKTEVKQVLVKGIDINKASEEQLIGIIFDLEDEVDKLSCIAIESSRIRELVEERVDVLKLVANTLDGKA